MNGERLFEISALNEEFWEKVILITVWHSSGMGGPGAIWIVTSDAETYFIGMEGLPYGEYALHLLTPILKRKDKIEDYKHPYESEEKGWKYLHKDGTLIREDFYKDFKKVYDDANFRKTLGWKKDHMPLLAGIALGLQDEPPRWNERNTFLKWKEYNECMRALEEKHKRLELDADAFIWKPMYPNNIPCNGQFGEFALLFKECDGKVTGYKFSIVYQRKEKSPLCYEGLNSTIERYNLHEQRYDDVFGPLSITGVEHEFNSEVDFKWVCTLHDYTVNHPGDFIRSFDTMEEAKSYALAVTRIRSYVTKENHITDLDNEERIYRNYLRKYEGIIFFRQHYSEILKIVCDYEFPDRNTGGGGYIADAIKEKLKIDDEMLAEIWQYIPLEITKREQDKAEKICGISRNVLQKGITK